MPGNVIIYIAVGGTGSGPFSMADKWRKDPYGTFVKEFIKARNWCDLNGVELRILLFQPAGYPESGVMPIDSWLSMLAVDKWFCSEMSRAIREFAPQCEWFGVYVGSLEAFDGTYHDTLKRSLAPYAVQGMTSLMIDQSSGVKERTVDAYALGRLDGAFAEVIIEGQYPVESDWLRDEYLNATVAKWAPSQPDKYIPLIPGDYVIATNVPDAMAGSLSTPEQKTAWKLAKVREWLPLGINCVVDVDELQGVTYRELCGDG